MEGPRGEGVLQWSEGPAALPRSLPQEALQGVQGAAFVKPWTRDLFGVWMYVVREKAKVGSPVWWLPAPPLSWITASTYTS